jgi:hypothetical protein
VNDQPDQPLAGKRQGNKTRTGLPPDRFTLAFRRIAWERSGSEVNKTLLAIVR